MNENIVKSYNYKRVSSYSTVNGVNTSQPINYVEESFAEKDLNNPNDPGTFIRNIYNPNNFNIPPQSPIHQPPKIPQPPIPQPPKVPQPPPVPKQPFIPQQPLVPRPSVPQQPFPQSPLVPRPSVPQPPLVPQPPTNLNAPTVNQNPVNFPFSSSQQNFGNFSFGGKYKLNNYGYFNNLFNSDIQRHNALIEATKNYPIKSIAQELNNLRNTKFISSGKIYEKITQDILFIKNLLKDLRGTHLQINPQYMNNNIDQNICPFLPFEKEVLIKEKPLKFVYGGNKLSNIDEYLKPINSELIDKQLLINFINQSNPEDIARIYYNGELKGIAVINYYLNCAFLEAFAANAGFRSPFIKFIKNYTIPENKNNYFLIVPDKFNKTFWNKYKQRDHDVYGYPIL